MKLAAGNHCPSGSIFPENPRVDLIEGLPQLDVSDRNVHFEHAVPVAAGRFEDCVNVGECLLCLFFDRAELLFAGRRINRELTGDEYETVVDSCLGVMSGGPGCVWGVDSFDFHNCFLRGKAALLGDSFCLLEMPVLVDHDNAIGIHQAVSDYRRDW